ncbi:MAG: hypothetical protein J6J74_07600 [Elusimicrobiaceae bacterium]|nr:hypothetical protein [Elusimicrobiaceae bacterium]
MFNIGQTVTKENYTSAAVWCNRHGAHIEKQNGAYVIVANAPAPEATDEEKVAALENAYGLPRAVRTGLIALRAGGAELDETLMARVDEIEALAVPLRTCV